MEVRLHAPAALPIYAATFVRDDLLLVGAGNNLRIHHIPSGDLLVNYEALWNGAKIHGIRSGNVAVDGSLEVLLFGNKKVEVLLVTSLSSPHAAPGIEKIDIISMWAHEAVDLVVEAQFVAPSEGEAGRAVAIGLAHNQMEEHALPWGFMGPSMAVQLYGTTCQVCPQYERFKTLCLCLTKALLTGHILPSSRTQMAGIMH